MSSLHNFEAEMGALTFGRIQSEVSGVLVTCPMSHEYWVAEMRSDANLSGLEPPAFSSVSLHSPSKASGGSARVNSVPLLQTCRWLRGDKRMLHARPNPRKKTWNFPSSDLESVAPALGAESWLANVCADYSFLFHPFCRWSYGVLLWEIVSLGEYPCPPTRGSSAQRERAPPMLLHHLLSWVTFAFGANKCHLGKEPYRFPACVCLSPWLSLWKPSV